VAVKKRGHGKLLILSEDRLTLKEAASKLRCTYKTIGRYATRGYSRVKDGSRSTVVLETLRVGGKVETSIQAIDRFLTAINE